MRGLINASVLIAFMPGLAQPFVLLNDDSTLKGVVLYYPNQTPDAEPKADKDKARLINRSQCVIAPE
jgi:hypothetical protein